MRWKQVFGSTLVVGAVLVMVSPKMIPALEGIAWQGVGPGGGGAWFGVAVDPSDASKALLVTDVGGIYKTTNGSVSWTNANGGDITDANKARMYYFSGLAYSPGNPSIVYAGAPNFLYKSTDGGSTWSRLSGTFVQPNALAVDPDDPNRVYAASGSPQGPIAGGNGCIYISSDGFASNYTAVPFTTAATDCTAPGDPDLPNVYTVLIDPNSGTPAARRVLLSTSKGLFQSTSSGASWTQVNTNMNLDQDYGQLALDRQAGVLYATIHTQVQQLPGSDGYLDPTTFVGGVFKSTDWGANWQVASGTMNPTSLLLNGGFETAGQGTPFANWTVIGEFSGGVVSRDSSISYLGGHSLKISTTTLGENPEIGVESSDFAVEPGALYRVTAMVRVGTGGGSSDYSTFYMPMVWFDSTPQTVVEHRCAPGSTGGAFLARLKDSNFSDPEWRRYETEVRAPDNAATARIRLSTWSNVGTTWVDAVTVRRADLLPQISLWQGITASNYHGIVVDPTLGGTLYVATAGANTNTDRFDGVWKSTDGGAHWSQSTRFLHDDNVDDKRFGYPTIDPEDPGDPSCAHQFAYDGAIGTGWAAPSLAIGSGSGHETVYFAANTIYKTANGGTSWEEVTNDPGVPSDPTGPTFKSRGETNNVVVLDVAMSGQRVAYGDLDNLLPISNDSGSTFRQEGRDRAQFWALCDEEDPESICVPGSEVHSVVFRPGTPQRVFAAVHNDDIHHPGEPGGVVSGCFSSDAQCQCDTDCSPARWVWTIQGDQVPFVAPAQLSLTSDNATLYAAIFGQGVYSQTVSSPSSSWNLVGGLPSTWGSTPPAVFQAWAVATDVSNNRVFVGIGADEGNYASNPANAGVWMYDGSAWCQISPSSDAVPGPYRERVRALRVTSTGELLAGADYLGVNEGPDHQGGLYKGTPPASGCQWTWTRLPIHATPDRLKVTGIAISPTNPQIIYAFNSQENALGNGAGVYKSVDGGATWNLLPQQGLMQLFEVRLAWHLDASSNNTVYASTLGSGLFKGIIQPPTAPDSLEATPAGPRKVQLYWADNSQTETGYQLQRQKGNGSWVNIDLGPNVTGRLDTTPTGGVYHYRIKAFCEGGDSGFSNTVTVIVQN